MYNICLEIRWLLVTQPKLSEGNAKDLRVSYTIDIFGLEKSYLSSTQQPRMVTSRQQMRGIGMANTRLILFCVCVCDKLVD